MNVLITAGPTREAIDPVRYLTNRSSGKMGYAIADKFCRKKHNVRLISGPVSLKAGRGIKLINVVTALEMLDSVKRNIAWCDVIVMAAAVADWRPAAVACHKIKKRKCQLMLKLVPTPDILQTIRPFKKKRVYVGFAAETNDLIKEASRKLVEKGLDIVVANDVSKKDSGFEVDTNRVTVISSSGWMIQLPLMSKKQVASRLVEIIHEYVIKR